jgi:hypothetical protein
VSLLNTLGVEKKFPKKKYLVHFVPLLDPPDLKKTAACPDALAPLSFLA